MTWYWTRLYQSLILCVRRSHFMYGELSGPFLPLDKGLQLHEMCILAHVDFPNCSGDGAKEIAYKLPSSRRSPSILNTQNTAKQDNEQDLNQNYSLQNMPPSMPVVWTPGQCIHCGSTNIENGICKDCDTRQ